MNDQGNFAPAFHRRKRAGTRPRSAVLRITNNAARSDDRAAEQTFAKGAWCHWLDDRVPERSERCEPGACPGRGANIRRELTSPCVIATAIACRCRRGRSLTGPTVRSSGPPMPLQRIRLRRARRFEVEPGQKGPAPSTTLKVKQDAGAIEIDTGVMTCRVLRHGAVCIDSIRRGGKDSAQGRSLDRDSTECAAGGGRYRSSNWKHSSH